MADNPRKLLYLSLTAKLSALLTSKLIRFVGRWNNQIDNDESERATIVPSVLIQIENKIEYTSASEYQLQKGLVIVTCHIGINVTKIDIGTKDWEIFQGVYELLQGGVGLEGTGFTFTPLERIDEIEDNNYDGYYHGKVIFKTYLQDCTKASFDDGSITGTIETINETVNRVEHGE